MPVANDSAYKNRITSAKNAPAPVKYNGNLNFLYFSLIVPESMAEGITAWAITRDVAATKAKTKHVHIILRACSLINQSSLVKIQRRLGLMLYNKISLKIQNILVDSHKTTHEEWIKELLVNYYDPMYDYQLEAKKNRCIFEDNKSEVTNFLAQIETKQSL